MCYDKLLGLRGCSSATEPVTGLYIDDLGINDTLLGQLITDQYDTGADLFNDKLKFAWKKVANDMLTRLSPKMKADTIIEGKRIGHALTNAANIDAALGAGKYGGIRVKIDPNNTSFLKFMLADLSVAVAGTDIQVLVFDMTTQQLVDTLTLTNGSTDQFFGKEWLAKRRKLDLAFVYEATDATYKMVAKKGACYDCGGNVKYAHICPFVDAQGIEITTDGTSVLTAASKKYTQGMSMTYNVSCDRESWLCSVGALMALPLAYATAVEIYDYALNTSPTMRVNTAVTLNKEAFVEARNSYATRYNDELTALLQNMRLPNDVHCFDCNRNIKYVTALP